MSKSGVWALLLAVSLMGGAAAAEQAVPYEAAWGQFASVVGKSTGEAADSGTSLSWRWETPGRLLLQEYRENGQVVRIDRINLASTSGKFMLATGGFLRREQLEGTLQPDGSVLFRNGQKQYVARYNDGAWELRFVEERGGRIEYLDQATRFPMDTPAALASSASSPMEDSRLAGDSAPDAAGPHPESPGSLQLRSSDASVTASRDEDAGSGDRQPLGTLASVWGQYAQVVGRSASAGPLQYELHWYWSVPGEALVQEFRHPADGTVKHREVITRGSTPGTLVLQGKFWGKKQWHGTLQPDGSVLYIGRALRKLPHLAGFLADGTWGMRLVELDDGRIASIADAPHRYRFADADAGRESAVAGAEPPVRAAPAATASVVEAAGGVPAIETVGVDDMPGATVGAEAPIERGAVPADPVSAARVPIVGASAPSIESASGEPMSADVAKAAAMLERLFSAWLAGHQPADEMVEHLRPLAVTRDMAALGPANEIRYVSRTEGGDGYAFDVAHANAKAKWTLYLDGDSGLIRNVHWRPLPPFAGELPLANPAVWGRVAVMANASVFHGAYTRYYRVSPDGHAIYVLVVNQNGDVRPEEILRAVGDGTLVRRRYLLPGNQRETFYRGQAMDGETVRWGMVGMSQGFAYHDWTLPANDAGRFIFTVYQFDQVRSSHEYQIGAKLHVRDSLGDAVAKAQAQDVGIVARFHQRWSEFLEYNSGHSTNAWARPLYDGLSAATLAARESEARSRASLDATVSRMQAQAGEQAHALSQGAAGAGSPPAGATTAAQPDPPAAGVRSVGASGGLASAGADASGTTQANGLPSTGAAQPLQFVLMIGMKNLPGDKRNPTCYSNVITRPGPPGWGARGSLPSGSAEQALREIDALKGAFIAACRASGREITSEGNFRHVRNQLESDEERVRTTGPRFPEDVQVVLN